MKKRQVFLPMLFVLFLFNGCIEDRITRKITHSQKTIDLQYESGKKDLQNKIEAIVPSEEVKLTTSVTQINKEPEYHSIHLELKNPENFPENVTSFSGNAEDLTEEVRRGISNIEDFEKLTVKVFQISNEEGMDKTSSYTKEIDL